MKPVRLEVNLDCDDNVNLAELIERIKAGCNVYGVIRVQAVQVYANYKIRS